MNIFVILFALYILAPKIDLIALFGSGIRLEDFISLVAAALYFIQKRRHPIPFPKFVRLYLLFVGVSYLSAAYNYGDTGFAGFLFATRLLQYMIWFFIMYEACFSVSRINLRRIIMGVSVVFLLWGGLEYFGLIGRVGKFTGAAERLTINTSGPFETSVMLAILAYAVPSLLLTPFMAVLVFLTQARITLLGVVVSLAAARPVRAALIGIVGGTLFFTVAQPVFSAFEESRLARSDSPLEMAESLESAWDRVPVIHDPAVFRHRFLSGNSADLFQFVAASGDDLSFRYRAVRWPMVIKATLFNSVTHVAIGWGPSAWGPAIDSYYVRTLGETGLIGLGLLGLWLFACYRETRIHSTANFAVVTMIVVGFFIDIFTSSKAMPLLWAFLALEFARHPFSMPFARRPVFGSRAIRRRPMLPAPVTSGMRRG
ncbi:hypothetical protein [Sphingosinithalassobacter sp. LHW66-3]|uniref:hypothetical protein n=1 Tax=Sphingosinithalassobacter sp. LHW66-3 TaxID=3424718 RepID=UPI003D6C3279